MIETCIYCGKETSDRRAYHDECRADYERNKGMSVTTTPPQAVPAGPPTPGGIIALHAFGWISLLVGLFFLVVSPNIKAASTEYSVTGSPPEVINLHKMFLGETFTIVGAIFLAAAWRPHR